MARSLVGRFVPAWSPIQPFTERGDVRRRPIAHVPRRRRVAAWLGAYVSALLPACRGSAPALPRDSRAAAPSAVLSNLTRVDYVGSAACGPCHKAEFVAWERSPMHRMTRDVRDAKIRAPFDGTRWKFKDDSVVLERRDGNPWLRVESEHADVKTYRIVHVIGGRTREDFTGVEPGGAREVVLPVSYVYATRSLRYKGYSVMLHEREGLRAGPEWSRSCIFCHNTVPEMDRLLGAIAGPAAHSYQGEQVDRWLPVEKRAKVRVLDARAFERAATTETERLGGALASNSGSPQDIAKAATDVVRARFDGDSLVEVGIGCEACHGGAREHVREAGGPLSFVARASWLDVALPMPTRASEINRVCARCHQVLFSRYPFTWEGGRRDRVAGGSHISSGEGRDFLLGGCAGTMACTVCHDPHEGGGRAGSPARELASPAGNRVCTACHAELADRARLGAHAHHDPEGRGGSCVACHMPRKNMGLDGSLTRYHRIGSPTDPARVLGDRPLECALCHADKTVGSLVDSMQSWWPVRYPTQRLVELYGSLDANVIRATLELGKPHEQVVSMATLGEVRALDASPRIAAKLLSEYPLVREWAKRALVSIRGRCDVDLWADDATIARQAVSCGAEDLKTPARTSPPVEDPSED
jgi:predicted CXXCH cytochrome family protein